jgi:hypothetical protein
MLTFYESSMESMLTRLISILLVTVNDNEYM